MIHIFRKEVNAFFSSLIAYLVIGLFLTGIGLYMWVFQPTVLEQGIANMDLLFTAGPYVLIFLIPAITMRTFAEENREGTIELLLTRPLTEWQIVLGKYLASLFLVFVALLPTLIYYYSIYMLGNPVGNIDTAAVIGSYVGLLLLGSAYTGIGIFASSLTSNQIVSFLLSAFICLIFYEGIWYLSVLEVFESWSLVIGKIGFSYHYDSLSKGVIDSRNVIYFLSVTAVAVTAARLILLSRSW